MSSASISQNDIIRKNISAISEAQLKENENRSLIDRIADQITDFSGSMLFVFIHVIWFGLWILLNLGIIHLPHISEFDPFPFGLLTMIVSLEAIFLSTFVLISQNRMAKLNEQRAELDLHINLLAEQKATKVLEMLDQITQQLDMTSKRFNFTPDPEVEALKISPEPQEVLEVMKEAVDETEEVGRTVKEISGEIKGVKEKVKEITGEMAAVREDAYEVGQVKETVEDIDEKIDTIGTDIHEIKKEIKERTEEDQHVVAK